MNTFFKLASKLSAITLLFIATNTSAFAAGGSVTFTGSATAVPSLSGSMLIVLCLLLFIVALRVAKQKNGNVNKLFMTLLGAGVIASAGSGIKLISNVNAGGSAVAVTIIELNRLYEFLPNTGGTFQNSGSTALNFLIKADDDSTCNYAISGGNSGLTNLGETTTDVLPAMAAVKIACTLASTPL